MSLPEKPVALLVDKEGDETIALREFLDELGLEVRWAKDGETAYNILDSERVDVLICELRIQRIDSMRLLRVARERNPEVCAVLLATHGEIDLATEAMRQGAYDFQLKPINYPKLAAVIHRGISHQRVVDRVSVMEERLDRKFGISGLIGNTPEIAALASRIRQIAPTSASVLITGETGTGKELIAQAIHHQSRRRDEALVKLNCAALAEGVVESELFGHERGAFTGAVEQRRGRFELADGGTLFLDEIAELSLRIQAKLLHVLQGGEFERVGGHETLRADTRVICATNRDLRVETTERRFREDLYFRLNVVSIHLPPLRERRADIPLLVRAFLDEFNRKHGRKVTGVTRGALRELVAYDWPGNVRELRNVLEGVVVFTEEARPLDVADLPADLTSSAVGTVTLGITVGMTMAEIERRAIQATLRQAGGEKKQAAAVLGIGLRTLYRKIKEYGVG
jgi:DNA-binding NtrC family response regulator